MEQVGWRVIINGWGEDHQDIEEFSDLSSRQIQNLTSISPIFIGEVLTNQEANDAFDKEMCTKQAKIDEIERQKKLDRIERARDELAKAELDLL